MARESRVFILSFTLSALFHFSMVTVFTIVIIFPRYDAKFYSFSIVDPDSRLIAGPSGREVLRSFSPDTALDKTFESEDGADSWEAPWSLLPPVELPTIEFAEFDRLKIRRESLELSSRFDSFFDTGPKDSWAKLGEKMESLGQTISRLASSQEMPGPGESPEPISRPALGFEAYLEWMSEPKNRLLISATQIRALMNLGPQELPGSLVFMLRINAEGKVVEVMTPEVDDADLVTSIGIAIQKYRFEPLIDSGRDQRATLIIRAAENIE